MPYKFTPYTSTTAKSEKRALLNAIDFSNDPIKAEREKALLSKALSFASNHSTQLYSMRDTTGTLKGLLGFVALSASEVLINDSKKPVVLVDLLIVNNKYRSTIYEYLDNSKVSQLLLEYAGSKFYDVREHIGVTYLILYPDGGKENKILVDFYKSRGFSYATNKHEWMYVKL